MGALQDGYCDASRVADLAARVDEFQRVAAAALGQNARGSRARGGKQAQVLSDGENSDSDGGGSISKNENTGLNWLVDAGMLLRDPPVFHLLLHETVSTHSPVTGVC